MVIRVHSASHSSMLKSDNIQNKIKAYTKLIFEHKDPFPWSVNECGGMNFLPQCSFFSANVAVLLTY